jgi:hypothetical protein
VARVLLPEEKESPPALVGPVVAELAAPGTSVAVAVEEIPLPALLPSNHEIGAVCGGRPGAQRLGRDRRERLARETTVIWAATPVVSHASPVCQDPII